MLSFLPALLALSPQFLQSGSGHGVFKDPDEQRRKKTDLENQLGLSGRAFSNLVANHSDPETVRELLKGNPSKAMQDILIKISSQVASIYAMNLFFHTVSQGAFIYSETEKSRSYLDQFQTVMSQLFSQFSTWQDQAYQNPLAYFLLKTPL